MSQLEQLLTAIGRELTLAAVAWQLVIVAGSLVAGWLVGQAIVRRIHEPREDADTWRFGRGGLARIASPLVALGCLYAAKALYARGHSTEILNVAVSLVTAFALIRLSVYLLRHVFPPNPVLKTWERGIAVTLWIGVALHVTGLAQPILHVLENELVFTLRGSRISLLDAILGVGFALITLFVALWASRLIEQRIMAAERLDLSLRVVTSKFVRTIGIVLAVLIALPLAGIPLTALSVFGGALGVGLGFGLQKIASSYVSGFIILLDRSVRPGDLITVDSRQGTVAELHARYMVLRGLDGTDAIIPNEALVTGTVLNHSYSTRRLLITVPIQIGYSSDLESALKILENAAGEEARILKEPAPSAQVSSFGDSGINLILYCWLSDPENGQAGPKSNIYRRVYKVFAAQGIEIPFPQRQVRVVGGESVGEAAARAGAA